jgi:outer membrane protein assembly factor BamB
VKAAIAEVEEGPVVVGHRIVDPETGEVVDSLDTHLHGMARPEAPGRYSLDGTIVDVASRTAVSAPDVVRFESGEVVHRSTKGVRWRFRLAGARSVRPPDLVTTKRMVVAAVESDLVGIDRATGKERWRITVPNDRLHAAGDLVLSLDSNAYLPAVPKRWLVARRDWDGTEVFRVELPRKADPEALFDLGRLLLVRNRHPHFSLVIDRTGRIVFELRERVSAGVPIGNGWLVVTDKRVARLDAKGSVVWELPGFENDFVMGTGILVLPGGDALVYNHGAISDSGVELLRVGLADGKVRWRRRADPLGVGHSKYRHQAYVVRIPGDELAVVSQGSYGSWIERVDALTGSQRGRWEFR